VVDGDARPPVVELHGVSRRYGTDPAVDALVDVDLAVHDGDWLAIVGPSGSGKSTLLNILGCLDLQTAGSYLLRGIDTAALSDRQRGGLRCRSIGFVFQSFNLLPRYSATRNVELPMLYGGVPRGERRQRAEAALTRVGLGERMHHQPSELSGGQQQRVSIARALVQNPVLLLADEPTGALDSETTLQIMDLFCELHRSGMTIILVTHEPAVAEYAQRILRVRDGRIVADERKVTAVPQAG
jgi:putative ABC transport system ATP-binding protein